MPDKKGGGDLPYWDGQGAPSWEVQGAPRTPPLTDASDVQGASRRGKEPSKGGGVLRPWVRSPGVGGAEGGPEEMRDHTASPRWAFVNKSGKAQGPDLLAKDPHFQKTLIGRNMHNASPARSGCCCGGRGGRQQGAAAEHCGVHMWGFYFRMASSQYGKERDIIAHIMYGASTSAAPKAGLM